MTLHQQSKSIYRMTQHFYQRYCMKCKQPKIELIGKDDNTLVLYFECINCKQQYIQKCGIDRHDNDTPKL